MHIKPFAITVKNCKYRKFTCHVGKHDCTENI